MMNISIIIW